MYLQLATQNKAQQVAHTLSVLMVQITQNLRFAQNAPFSHVLSQIGQYHSGYSVCTITREPHYSKEMAEGTKQG